MNAVVHLTERQQSAADDGADDPDDKDARDWPAGGKPSLWRPDRDGNGPSRVVHRKVAANGLRVGDVVPA